ncbi:TonB-linked SusC/RagA family outer membrane protein [Chitinophaga dinghuensis]|uniref:TonB-linked SusC/RagA family outer membrane protein n=2 Tax=Chitinophaga dinghuensis TaxID=1539050 RepID=A0A327W6Y7_9BACT|nr:TonB-linked SusC/RagA family outer membrane protein [Chitinophaga dinghuensis]
MQFMQKNANCSWYAMPGNVVPVDSHHGSETCGNVEGAVWVDRQIPAKGVGTGLRKLLITMKLTALIILVSIMQVAAEVRAQNITFSAQKVSLHKVFAAIEKQTGYLVFYKKDVLQRSHEISVNAKDLPLGTFMEEVLKDQPIDYEMMSKTIILTVKNERETAAGSSVQQQVPRSGKVTDKKGNPLIGVSVQVKGMSRGVITGADGHFSITAGNNDILIFNYIGFKPHELAIGDKTIFNVVMEENVSGLNEVIVTGYQSVAKKLFTGSATNISGAEVKQDGVLDVSRMLEGKVAGVSVQNVSGTFGAAPKIRVRGATSISGENKPLWVIDNVVLEDIVNISNDQLSSGDALTLIGSSVAGINADDIESFTILKDAAATAQYGARAMNGVVVITTKKGRAGNTTVNYNGNYSTFLKPSYDNFNIMNSADQMSVYAELARKGNLTSSIANGNNGGVYAKMYQMLKQYDETTGKFGLENTPEARAAFLQRYAKANTDWFGLLFKNSFVQEHSLSISSGTEKAQHYISLGYYNDNGWSIADRVSRYTANINGTYNLTNRLTAKVIVNGSIRQQRAPGTQGRSSNVVEGVYTRDFDINPYSYALNTSRTMTAYDEFGNLEYFNRNYAPFNIINELQNNSINLDMLDTKIQGELGYKISKDFNFRTIGAVRFVKTTRENLITENSNMALAYRYAPNSTVAANNPFLYLDPDHPENTVKQPVLPQGGFYNRNDDKLVNYYVRNQLDFHRDINEKHSVSAFLGQEIKYTDRQNSYSNGYGYQYDKGGTPFTDYRIIKMLLEGGYNYYGMNLQYDRYASFFGNFSYGYDNKYVFQGTLRYDGSNRMGQSSNARWLPTWTLSAAWNLDQEEFLKYLDHLSFLKLRASYGLTASIGSATNSSVVFQNNSAVRPRLSEVEPRIEIDHLENAELTWEKQYEANVGIDAGFWGDKLSVSADLYQRNGFDLISALRTSGIGGEGTKQANYADMKSYGAEITIGGRIIKTKTFNWSTNLTFGFNKNKITNMKSKPRIYDLIVPEGGAMEGHAVRGLYSINFQGLDSIGKPKFIDENGKLANGVYVQSTNKDYLIYEGSVDPTITGGWNNTFNYKNFTLNFFFSYQAGNKIRLNNAFALNYSDADAMPKEFLDRWTLPMDEKATNVPSIADYLTRNKVGSVYPWTVYNYTSGRVADGSFVRLKQLSLAYNLPTSIAKLIRANNVAVKLQGNNLWLVYADKKLKGQDPEFFTSGGVALPVPRQFTFTLKVGF